MLRLLPDDPVWATRFFAVEELLTDLMNCRYLNALPADASRTVAALYKNWRGVAGVLPPAIRARHMNRPWSSAPVSPNTYSLRGPRDTPLTALYAVPVEEHELQGLTALLHVLDRAESDASDPLFAALRQNTGYEHVDAPAVAGPFQRALAVLEISPDPVLLRPFRSTHCGTVTAIALNKDEERRYRAHCAEVIRILSGDDPWALEMHMRYYS